MLQRCSNCTLPVTWESISIGESGVCNICSHWEDKEHSIDWEERKNKFLDICNEAKEKAIKNNSNYDCIVPFSGGKDSTFTLLEMVRTYNMKCLVVSFDHGFFRPKTIDNRIRTFRKLGVDVIIMTPDWQMVKKMMVQALIRKGDFCWHCHAGVFAYPMQIALRFDVPLVVWGEGGGEYEAYFDYKTIQQYDEHNFNRKMILGIRAEDMAGFINEDLRSLSPFIYPPQKEIVEAGIVSIPLGKFRPWDAKKQSAIIMKELGWQEDIVETAYPGPTYEKVECMLTGVRDYVKYLKRGFSRITHMTTLDIRHGRMTHDEGMKLIEKYEGNKPQSLKIFLDYVELTEEEFNDIVLLHVIPPFDGIDLASLEWGEKLWDQDIWFNERE